MPSVTPFGEKLRSLRKAFGLTQLELALRAGVSERTVRNAERSRPLKREFLEFLATALGVELSEIAHDPAELDSYFDWRQNLLIADEFLRRVTDEYDASSYADIIHPRHEAIYNCHGCVMGGMVDRYMDTRRGVDEAKRIVDFIAEFSDRIIARQTVLEPPAGDGRLVVLRGTDHLTYRNGFEESVWVVHLIEFDRHRIRRWDQYNGPLRAQFVETPIG